MTTAFVYDPWSISGSTSNDVLMDFEGAVLQKRWLHGPRVDEPVAFESYAGSTAAGSGTAHEVFADRMGSVTKIVEAATGTIAAENTYDSFGNPRHQHRNLSGACDLCLGFDHIGYLGDFLWAICYHIPKALVSGSYGLAVF